MDTPRLVAIVDIGKTNAKLVLHDLASGTDLFEARRPNEVRLGPPYPHFDAQALWSFILGALTSCARHHQIDAICVTTHGACAALVNEAGLVLPILDYEASEPDATSADYDAIRPLYSTTFSPRLPGGLNLGAQLFWLSRTFPDEFAATRHVLAYPQYWVWRLTGRAVSEATSLGCHTDLWAPAEARFSSLVAEEGWTALFPPLASAFDAVADLHPEIAAACGLGERPIPVHGGIHDSNASLLPHLIARAPPFSVVSTGTWIVSFAVGAPLARLDEHRDMLANVDAFQNPVPSARFMGGREFDLLTRGSAPEPSAADIARVLDEGIAAAPSLAPGTGPFPLEQARWSHPPDELTSSERTAVATLYVAAMTAACLDAMGAGGPSVVEGPFARNALFVQALECATGRSVIASPHATGTSAGAALLAAGPQITRAAPKRAAPSAPYPSRLDAYLTRWAAQRARSPQATQQMQQRGELR